MRFEGIPLQDLRQPAFQPGSRARRPATRRRVPAQLRQPAKPDARLEALHVEAGVLVHDLNNLLGVILNANEALAVQFAEGSLGAELALASQDAAERGAELLRRMLDLSAPEAEARPAACDAVRAVADVARLARLSAPAGVSIELDVAEIPATCAADAGELNAALLNLCINAGHAMPAGGLILISAEQAGDEVVLSVTDTGCGMSPEVLARCTEAFFSTRKGRGGTGLGLAGVQDFANRCGGRLELNSEEGQGTTATLRLPRA